MERIWRIWALALGRKEGRDKKDADQIALLRTIIIVQAITTNVFIVSGVIRHWNDVPLNNCNTSLIYHGNSQGDQAVPTQYHQRDSLLS